MVLPSYGNGDRLPIWLLALCGSFTVIATGVSIMSIVLQLKNYRKPALQRAVVRIMVMVPLYAISSFIAIFSLEAAFFIDAVRDLYEAFVIYTFLQLLITYLGGERSLLIILNGRPPIPHTFPVNLFLKPMDVSDPWTLLNLKRGVLQYVQIKPVLVLVTVVCKATGTYQEGVFASDNGYTYVSVVYNVSIFLSLYCLAMFWVAVGQDLKPFRPVPKFLCVKGILFFSFWQSTAISLLASTGVIKHIGPYTDKEHMSLALTDSLMCFEMPLFAIGHQFAFQASDYIDDNLIYAARLPFIYALRDSFGMKDVWEDTKDTLRGRGISYQAYEPAEGAVHHDIGRQKRIRAGLRYSKGGKAKYWLRMPGEEGRHQGTTGTITSVRRRLDERLAAREGYAPLLPDQAADVVHDDPNQQDPDAPRKSAGLFESESEESDAPSLDFETAGEEEDALYERARRIGYAGFPNVDVSQEAKKRKLWEEEEGILAGKWSRGGSRERLAGSPGEDGPRWKGKGKGKGKGREGDQPKKAVYGAWADRSPASRMNGNTKDYGATSQADDADTEADRLRPPTAADRARAKARPGKAGKTAMDDAQMRWKKERISHADASSGDESKSKGKHDKSGARSPLPPDAVDLVIDDAAAIEAARTMHRADSQNRVPTHIYRHTLANSDVGGAGSKSRNTRPEVEEVYGADHAGETEMLKEDDEPIAGTEEVLGNIEEQVADDQAHRSQATSPYDQDNPWA